MPCITSWCPSPLWGMETSCQPRPVRQSACSHDDRAFFLVSARNTHTVPNNNTYPCLRLALLLTCCPHVCRSVGPSVCLFVSAGGRVVACIIIVMGIITIALPVSILASRFPQAYSAYESARRQKVAEIRHARSHVARGLAVYTSKGAAMLGSDGILSPLSIDSTGGIGGPDGTHSPDFSSAAAAAHLQAQALAHELQAGTAFSAAPGFVEDAASGRSAAQLVASREARVAAAAAASVPSHASGSDGAAESFVNPLAAVAAAQANGPAAASVTTAATALPGDAVRRSRQLPPPPITARLDSEAHHDADERAIMMTTTASSRSSLALAARGSVTASVAAHGGRGSSTQAGAAAAGRPSGGSSSNSGVIADRLRLSVQGAAAAQTTANAELRQHHDHHDHHAGDDEGATDDTDHPDPDLLHNRQLRLAVADAAAAAASEAIRGEMAALRDAVAALTALAARQQQDIARLASALAAPAGSGTGTFGSGAGLGFGSS